MKKRRHPVAGITIGVVLAMIGMVLIWFHIPYSPLKAEFDRDVRAHASVSRPSAVFDIGDFAHLPPPVRRFMERSGFIGTRKSNHLMMRYENVMFLQGKQGPQLTIDYTQHNFAGEPARLALIESGMFGVPFDGYDYYSNGAGGMKGVLGKAVTLFDQRGKDMDQACLATYLAEILFLPVAALDEHVVWEPVDDHQAKATIDYGGVTASGTFTFNERDEMTEFTTADRAMTDATGHAEQVPWSAVCGSYRIHGNGLRLPTTFQAVWHCTDGDFTYFDGHITQMEYA